jgi:hypothetical protein
VAANILWSMDPSEGASTRCVWGAWAAALTSVLAAVIMKLAPMLPVSVAAAFLQLLCYVSVPFAVWVQWRCHSRLISLATVYNVAGWLVWFLVAQAVLTFWLTADARPLIATAAWVRPGESVPSRSPDAGLWDTLQLVPVSTPTTVFTVKAGNRGTTNNLNMVRIEISLAPSTTATEASVDFGSVADMMPLFTQPLWGLFGRQGVSHGAPAGRCDTNEQLSVGMWCKEVWTLPRREVDIGLGSLRPHEVAHVYVEVVHTTSISPMNVRLQIEDQNEQLPALCLTVSQAEAHPCH